MTDNTWTQRAGMTSDTDTDNLETYAEQAEASKVAAAASETAAAGSASAAATSASLSQSQVSLATAQAAIATSQASASASSATASASSAVTAATAQTAAETAKAAAETAETNASASASAAAAQAGIATTKAGEAAASATASASSATASEAAKDAALAALDNFDDRYLGAKASDPTVDNDGNPLISGALYFNTTDDVMKVYEGSQWVAAYASLSGALLAANNLSDLASASSGRTNLGLGTAATTASTDYATAAQGATADAALPKAGGALTGPITTSSTVDGRDVAADGSKLDGIEAGAKDDQTITAGSGLSGGGTGNVTLSHADTSSVSNSDNSGNTFIQDLTFDTYGHVTAVGTGSVSVGNGTLTVQGTGALGGSGTFTANQSSNATISISHDDTSSQGSVDNSGATVIQDVTLDGYGHVTGLGSHTLTLANLGYTGATNANYITNNNQLTNGAGYTTNVGDITNVSAGTNLTGGGSSGSVTLNVTASPTFTTVTATTFNTTSDRNTKTDIEPISDALGKVQQLGGYSFTFKDSGEKSSGVIAQEVQAVLPELVQEGGEGHLTVQYGNMVGLLIEAIKEQQAQIDALTAKLNG